MSGGFRRVEGEQAGPSALGILVPPGRRTFVILRPRSLDLDLLLCRGIDDPGALQLGHDEATAVAQSLFRVLRESPDAHRDELQYVPREEFGWLRLRLAGFAFVVCRRLPGQPYSPLMCSVEEANTYLDAVRGVLCPDEGTEQEIYFNMRFFDRIDPPSGRE